MAGRRHNQLDADDQVQNSVLKAYLHLDSCDAAKFRSWLDRIVRNECLMAHREQRSRPGHSPYARRDDQWTASPEATPEDLLAEKETAQMVHQAVCGLP
jgi:DNA-directed RNA polymerase specialized sigma24 family protein